MVTKAEISFVRSLSGKRGRAEHGFFVVEGRKLVDEAIASGFDVERVFSSNPEDCGHIPSVEFVSRKDIERMSALKTPQGILAVIKIPEYPFPRHLGAELALALDCIQDPGNLGTIVRIADWFGIKDIICSPDTADCFNPKVVQSTMGAIFRVRLHYMELKDVFIKASESGCPVYGTYLDGENIYAADLGVKPAGIIVMGNEGNGISDELSDLISRKLFIPPYPADVIGSESLNVGSAAAVIVSEFRRRN